MSRLLDVHDFVGDKLAWQHRALTHPDLSVTAKAVASLMMHDLNVTQGGAWRGQEGIAQLIGVCARQVRRALAELKAAGFLQIEVGKGRGRTNIYRALMPEADGEPGSLHAENRTQASSQSPQNRTQASSQNREKRTREARKQDTHVLQSLEKPFTPPYPPAHHRSATNPKREITAVFLDRQVRDLVVSIGGEAAAVSYLDQARWDAAKRAVVCRSHTAFSRLQDRYRRPLADIGVSITLDPGRHAQLPCPTFAPGIAA